MNKADFDKIPLVERMNCVLEGTAYFASLHKPNTKSAAKFNSLPAYSLSLGLDETNFEKAKRYGLRVVPPNESIPMPHVVLKRRVKAGVDPAKVKPSVVDSMQKEVPPTILVGNESKVIAKFGTYYYPNNGGGVGAVLFKVQIRELVPYKPSDNTFVMEEGGFTVDSFVDDDEPPFETDTGEVTFDEDETK
jgi:hypothetical protein